MANRPLTGEPLPLDLVNTRWPVDGEIQDALDWAGGLDAWLAENGVTVEGPVERYLGPLKTARGAIRQALDLGMDDEVNAVLAHGRVRLALAAGRPAEEVEVDDEVWRPAWMTIRAFLDLLATAPPGRLRRCDGPACVLWFLDTSRNGRRRWCSMEGCGNRAKAKAHYDRTRV